MIEKSRVELAESGSPFLESASELHSENLQDTLTSARGPKTVLALYRYLIRQGHSVCVAVTDHQVIGGLVVLRRDAGYSPLVMFALRPMSWLTALSKIGLTSLVTQLYDLLRVRFAAKSLDNHDYILALYVDPKYRRLGLARTLLTRAKSDASRRGADLAVDTLLNNDFAQQLYASHGFSEFRRTKRSVILVHEA